MMPSRRDRHFQQLAGVNLTDGLHDFRGVFPHQRPPVGQQNHDSYVGIPEVLLVPYVLVGGDEDIVSVLSCLPNECPVDQTCPALLSCGFNVMLAQIVAE